MTEPKFAGLTNLQKELLESLKDEGTKERKELAMSILDWIDAASVPGYVFDGDDYFPSGDGIDPLVVRDIKIYVRAQARWNTTRPPQVLGVTKPTSPAPTVCETASDFKFDE